MSAFLEVKYKCIVCEKEFKTFNPLGDFYIGEANIIKPLCKKCGNKVKRMIKELHEKTL